MTVAVLVSPPVAPPPVPSLWPGVRHEFTGWDGSVWVLSDWRHAGVFVTDKGLRGLHQPAVADYTSQAAGVDGQRFRGFRVEARDCFWPLVVWSDVSSQAWLDRDAALWRALMPGRSGTWTVRHPSGTRRSLRVRVVPDGDHAYGADPAARGWQVYGVALVADDPYWAGSRVSVTGGDLAAESFIDDEGSPPFWISGGAPLAGLSLENPGDVAAWPVWRAVGPHVNLTVGVDGHLVQCPDLASGEVLELDTSPWVRTALVDGADATGELGGADFAPVPPGGSVPLFASSLGNGSVTCSVSPRHFRAW